VQALDDEVLQLGLLAFAYAKGDQRTGDERRVAQRPLSLGVLVDHRAGQRQPDPGVAVAQAAHDVLAPSVRPPGRCAESSTTLPGSKNGAGRRIAARTGGFTAGRSGWTTVHPAT
jgi:hypothetical protein